MEHKNETDANSCPERVKDFSREHLYNVTYSRVMDFLTKEIDRVFSSKYFDVPLLYAYDDICDKYEVDMQTLHSITDDLIKGIEGYMCRYNERGQKTYCVKTMTKCSFNDSDDMYYGWYYYVSGIMINLSTA